MIILGINPGHDATATLLKDGEVIAAIAEERITRIKYHFGFPYEAIRECMKITNISSDSINYVVFNFNSMFQDKINLGHQIIIEKSGSMDPSNEVSLDFLWNIVKSKISNKAISTKSPKEYFCEALAKLEIEAPIRVYDHHLCHAASAYFDFGHENSLIVTADGAGDGLSASVTLGNRGKLKVINTVSDLYSVGRFYSAVTKFLGFKRNRHEGKVTGLAAYGDYRLLYDKLKKIIYNTADGVGIQSALWNETSKLKKGFTKFGAFMKGMYYHGAHPVIMEYLENECSGYKREDVAAAAQKLTEDIMRTYVNYYVQKTGVKKIALAGGIFANVRVNQEILEIPHVEEVFVYPNMGDGGTATGAAYLLYNDLMREKASYFKPKRIDNVYYGPSFDDKEIETALKKGSVDYYKPDSFADEVAKLVYDGKIVGHFNGRMEYGPRALGARTILANATDKKINDWLNRKLKRTEFMPFAPVCLEERAKDVFQKYESGRYPANFMTITFNMVKEWGDKLQAITHVDSTARPQTINKKQLKPYYDILESYSKMSDLPVLINTSFNSHEEPIVMTPQHAINSLKMKCIDVLAIGDFIVTRS